MNKIIESFISTILALMLIVITGGLIYILYQFFTLIEGWLSVAFAISSVLMFISFFLYFKRSKEDEK
jgi:hypothetical protein